MSFQKLPSDGDLSKSFASSQNFSKPHALSFTTCGFNNLTKSILLIPNSFPSYLKDLLNHLDNLTMIGSVNKFYVSCVQNICKRLGVQQPGLPFANQHAAKDQQLILLILDIEFLLKCLRTYFAKVGKMILPLGFFLGATLFEVWLEKNGNLSSKRFQIVYRMCLLDRTTL